MATRRGFDRLPSSVFRLPYHPSPITQRDECVTVKDGSNVHADPLIDGRRDADVGQGEFADDWLRGRRVEAGLWQGQRQGAVGVNTGRKWRSRAPIESGGEVNGQDWRGVRVRGGIKRGVAPVGGPLTPKPSRPSMINPVSGKEGASSVESQGISGMPSASMPRS